MSVLGAMLFEESALIKFEVHLDSKRMSKAQLLVIEPQGHLIADGFGRAKCHRLNNSQ